jgi:hypothetical protein
MKRRLFVMIFPVVFFLSNAVCFAGDYEDGLAAYDRKDYKTALANFTKAANKGDAKVQHMLGGMY